MRISLIADLCHCKRWTAAWKASSSVTMESVYTTLGSVTLMTTVGTTLTRKVVGHVSGIE